MEGGLSSNWRIPAATTVALALVGGAYWFAHGVGSPSSAEASTQAALLQAIATKDSTGDGLPDWEKALYGIPLDATTTDYFHLGMTDAEAVARGLIVPKAVANIPAPAESKAEGAYYSQYGLTPSPSGTLTDAFAKNFFTLYLAAKEANGGVDLSSDQANALANRAMDDFLKNIAPAPGFKTLRDLKVSGTGPDALRAYASAAEAVFTKNASDATKSEIQYLQDAVLHGDESALGHIASIAKSDRDTAVGIAALPVPAELASANLELVNALMRLGQINNDLSRVNTDSLATILALGQYDQATRDLAKAFNDVHDAYSAAGVELKAGAPGAAFVNLVEYLSTGRL